jgi:hypothetical protein
VSAYSVKRLADELELDTSQVYRWVRGDCGLPVQKAIAIVEIARARGIDLSLEDLYGQYFAQIRARIRARIQTSLPPR